MQPITLDSKLAKEGSGGSTRISAKGKFKGVIEHMKVYQTDSSSTFINFTFKADNGQDCRFSICIFGKDGKPTFGFKQLQAMMACCKIRSLTPTKVIMDDYNLDTKQVEKMERDVYKEFSGAKIGFALYRHDRPKYSDPSKMEFVMEISAPFNYDSEQTAQEVLDSKPPASLEKIIQNLTDKETKSTAQSAGGYSGYESMPEANGSMEDDIPF
jgi:hypothetical protein